MPFLNGCSCQVWAIDGYVSDVQTATANNSYANYGNGLAMAGTPLGNMDARVAAIVAAARQGQTVADAIGTIFGGWNNDVDATPMHMWLVYRGKIYDTMPGAPLRRKNAGFMGWNHRHPPSEAAAFAANRVGSSQELLTRSQLHQIGIAVWDANNEYTPADLSHIPGW